VGCELAAKTKAIAPKSPAPVKSTPPPKPSNATVPSGPAGGNALASLPVAKPPESNTERDRDVRAARAAREQFEATDVGPLVIDQQNIAPPCPGLHACHTEPGPRIPLFLDTIDLEGKTWFPLSPSTVSSIWKKPWDPHRVPVKWGTLAKGYLVLQKGDDGELYSGGLQALLFSHPALPARAGVMPALAIEVDQGFISGGLSSTTSQPAITSSPPTVKLLDSQQASKLAELDDLQGLMVGKFTNTVSRGRLDFSLRDLDYWLDGVFPGKGAFVLGQQQPLQGTASVEAVGVAKQEFPLDRDADARISAVRQLDLALKPPGKDDSWSGSLSARFSRGTYDIRGTANYASPSGEIRGSVTVILTDRCSAWAAVRQRLGPAAPVGPVADESAVTMALVGWGVLDFNLSKWLKGTAEVVVDPDGYITTRGRLVPDVSYTLFPYTKVPQDKIPGTKINIPKIPLVGDYIVIDGGFKFDVAADYGPAVLFDITAEGVYSTNPQIPTEFDLTATLSAAASGKLTLVIWGGITAGVGAVGVTVKLDVTGTATLKGYAEARPHIARRRVRGAHDGSTEYVIYGDLEVAAALDCALSGDIKLEALYKTWATIHLGSRTWRIDEFGVRLGFDHVIGSGKLPTVTLGNQKGDVKFNDWKFMNAAVHDQTATGSEHQGEEHDDFTSKPVKGELPAAHAPTPGTPQPDETPATQAAGPLEPVVDQPPPKRVQTPATGDTMPTVSPPPTEHADVWMNRVHHDLTLVLDDPPTIHMASADDQLSRKLAIAVKAISDEIDLIKQGGVPPDQHTLKDLENEKAMLNDLLAECLRVELAAARLGHHPAQGLPSHVPGFTELAERLHAYGTQYDRSDLISTPAAKVAPATPVRQRPAALAGSKTPDLDDLEKIEPGVSQRYVEDYQDYLVNGGDQGLVIYVNGRAARKLGRIVEPLMIKKFEDEFKKSSRKLNFDILDPTNPNEDLRVRRRVPDIYVENFAVGDVKDVEYQSNELQLQDDFAIAAGGASVQRAGTAESIHDPPLKVYVIGRKASHLQEKTRVSGPLLSALRASGGDFLWWIPDPKEK
jgi:hypothetical protein